MCVLYDLVTWSHNMSYTIKINLFTDIFSFNIFILISNKNQIVFFKLPCIFLDPNLQSLLINVSCKNHNKFDLIFLVLKTPSPRSWAKCFCSMDWNVIPTTWQTNFLIESKKPVIFWVNSGVVLILAQNSWKSHCSKMSAK